MSKKSKKERTEADEIILKQIIKSATAVVCAAAVCTAVVSSTGKMSEALVKSAEASATGAVDTASEDYSSDSGITDFGTDTSADTGTADNTDTTADVSADTTADDPASTDTGAATADSTVAGTKTDAAKQNTNGAPQSKAEIIAYCNKALNDAKAAKVGYTKTFVRKGGDNLPSIVSSVIAQNKTTTAQKGDANIVDDFPAAGYTWSSKLRESDVQTADIKTNGQYYEITLKLGKETNPGKGEASSYGRVMSVIDANDAKEMVSAVKTINMTYHDGYVYAKIDSKTGRLVKAEFSASADISATLSIIGDLSAQNIVSTETFTDIKW